MFEAIAITGALALLASATVGSRWNRHSHFKSAVAVLVGFLFVLAFGWIVADGGAAWLDARIAVDEAPQQLIALIRLVITANVFLGILIAMAVAANVLPRPVRS